MSEQKIEEAVFCLQGIRRSYGEPEAGNIQLLLDYITQLEAEVLKQGQRITEDGAKNAKYKEDSKRLDKLENFIASQRPRIQIYWSNIYMQGREFVIQCRDGEYRGFGLGEAIDKLEEQDH